MAFLKSQIDIINSLADAVTITDLQARELLSTTNGFSAAQITFIKTLGLSDADQDIILSEARSTQEQIEEEIAQAKEYLLVDNVTQCRKYVTLAEITMASMVDYELGNRRVQYRESIRFIKNSLDDLEIRLSTTAAKNRRVFARYVRN
tara:strand:- start:425 stop:868 length:444 start_codon:yes stop_codon:yes gene_type:complete